MQSASVPSSAIIRDAKGVKVSALEENGSRGEPFYPVKVWLLDLNALAGERRKAEAT